ncbi:uncharacterized protein [Neodiprion pinetum]|uniref:uncharacterized protein n=1 Tax=Neodiprion pinetum TaxID=441929 RepID=UPI001EDFE54A|nr:uncharacterized protein LOC124217284 [Neodiprion pinetum]
MVYFSVDFLDNGNEWHVGALPHYTSGLELLLRAHTRIAYKPRECKGKYLGYVATWRVSGGVDDADPHCHDDPDSSPFRRNGQKFRPARNSEKKGQLDWTVPRIAVGRRPGGGAGGAGAATGTGAHQGFPPTSLTAVLGLVALVAVVVLVTASRVCTDDRVQDAEQRGSSTSSSSSHARRDGTADSTTLTEGQLHRFRGERRWLVLRRRTRSGIVRLPHRRFGPQEDREEAKRRRKRKRNKKNEDHNCFRDRGRKGEIATTTVSGVRGFTGDRALGGDSGAYSAAAVDGQSTTVAGPMSPRSNSEEPSGTEGDNEIVYQRGSLRRKENENEDEDIAPTQPPPSPTNHSSMESRDSVL